MELYSNSPPNIAPRIFEDNAIEIVFSIESCLENANPEKKIGIVSTTGVKIFCVIELKVPWSINVKR